MKFYRTGTKVTTNVGNVDAVITAVELRSECITYELTYFIDNDFKKVWMSESQFQHQENAKKQTIGFK